jgi:hypothetical protein
MFADVSRPIGADTLMAATGSRWEAKTGAAKQRNPRWLSSLSIA